jgi:hypothetical protein
MKINQKRLTEMSSTVAEISKYRSAFQPKTETVKIVRGIDGKNADPAIVASLIKDDVSREVVRKLVKNGDFIDLVRGEKGDTGEKGETEIADPNKIADKLNTLTGVIDPKVLKNFETTAKIDLPDIIEKVVDSIKKSKRLDVKDITGAPQKTSIGLNFNDQRWHGAGVTSLTAGTNITITVGTDGGYIISATPAVPTVLATASTINDSNLNFVFTTMPTILIINGGVYAQTGGAITWTWNAGTLTATLSSAVGTNGSIFGM